MKIEIKNKWTGRVLIVGKYESIKDALKQNTDAVLTDADLRGADLTDAVLRGADLTDADLRGADLTDAMHFANSDQMCQASLQSK